MHSHIELVDHCAVAGRSVFHRASVVGKALFLCLAVCAAFLSRGTRAMLIAACLNSLFILGLSGAGISGLLLLWYPLIFGALFGVLMASPVIGPGFVVARVFLIASSVALVLLTTPVHKLAGLSAWVLPPFLNETLLSTYRSVFLLLKRVSVQSSAARLRGMRLASPRALAHVFYLIATVIINALDDASRAGAAIGTRAGVARTERHVPSFGPWDWIPLVMGISYVLFAIRI